MAARCMPGRRTVLLKAACRALALIGGLLAVASAFAQLGDAPGERQESLVSAERIPPTWALSPEEALVTLRVAPGYRVELAAAEPHVQDPVAISFGPDGRLWVVEMRGFMPDLDGTGEDAPVGRVVVLRDHDGDGRYDRSQVFVDGLVLPRTVLVVGEGVLVGAPPELAWWHDTDGDGRADKKHVLATDYGVKVDPKRPFLANPELAPNGLLWGRDNWIYSAAYTKKFRYVHGEWEVAPTSFRGQWGLTQDDYGRLFHNSNSDQLRLDVIAAEYLHRNPNQTSLSGANVAATTDQRVWPIRVTPGVNRGYDPNVLRDGKLVRFTAACAPWVYRGNLLSELYGNAFVAEPAANLVRRNRLSAVNGLVAAQNADGEAEFLASTDERFRPVNFATGPDGALYIVDLYRGVLQHRLSLTTYLRRDSAARGLVEPRQLGRIYRVVPDVSPGSRAIPIPATSTGQWISRLDHPNAWWRETAQQQLVERRDRAAIPLLHEFLLRATALGRMHALWTLQGLQALDPALLIEALTDKDPLVRTAAVRLSEPFLVGPTRSGVITQLLDLLRDSSPEVRLQVVLSLGEACDSAVDESLARAVLAHPGQPFMMDALCSGLSGREVALLERLAVAPDWPADEATANTVLAGLARAIWASRDAGSLERLFRVASACLPTNHARALALTNGMADAAGQERRPVSLPRRPDGWEALSEQGTLRERMAALSESIVWPGKPGGAAAAVAPLSEGQTALFNTGREIYAGVCAGCHQASGRGLDGLAPPLLDSEWVLGSPQRAIRVLLHGLTGPIKVRKRQYTGEMPAFGEALNDEQVAGVLTYIRREWGHGADPVESARVTAERTATAGHVGPWSAEELRTRNLDAAPSK